MLDYWRWANSDLIGNVSRGVLAEYLVALAVGATSSPRDPWAAYDVVDPNGITIEVKSAAYLQAWDQRALSKITFLVKPTASPVVVLGETPVVSRRSHVWVFALLHHTDQETLDPLDLTQWTFWVVPTPWLDARERSQHSIGLLSLKASPFGAPVTFGALASTITSVARSES
ncbi:MAG: hypothetical protein NVV57_01475 [Demequina sp.]|nr:hypothetical protein [Demequina sp.]